MTAELPAELRATRLVELLPDESLTRLLAPCEVMVQEGLNVFAIPVRPQQGTAELPAILGARAVFGVWGVRGAEDAQWAKEQGAGFVLVDVWDQESARILREAGVPAFPAALTPTEVLQAWSTDCAGVQVVPADLLRRGWPRVLATFAVGVPLIPRGALTSEEAKEWLDAGALAVGLQPGFAESSFGSNDLGVLRSRCQAFRDEVAHLPG